MAPPAPVALPTVRPTEPEGQWASDLCEPSALAWSGSSWIVADNEVKDHVFELGSDWSAPQQLAFSPTEVGDAEALLAGGQIIVGSHTFLKKDGSPAKDNRRRVVNRATAKASTIQLALFDPARAEEASQAAGRSLQDLLVAAQGKVNDKVHPTPYNVEGATYAGAEVLFGLRGPLDADGRAILLRGPKEPDGGSYRVSDAIRLQLFTPQHPTPQGIREISPWRDGWLIVGGTPSAQGHDAEEGSLWWWPSLTSTPTFLETLPTSTEGVWALDEGHVLIVIDGEAWPKAQGAPPSPGRCKEPGKWKTLAVALP